VEEGGVCEIHVLTSAADWLNLIWALKSFYYYSGRRYALCIHDDGTLTSELMAILEVHFPGARIIQRAEADAEIEKVLLRYPRCLRFRRTNHLAPKLFDFTHYLAASRMLLLDSDVLFFRAPIELLRRCEDSGYQFNSVNADVATAYTVSSEDVRLRCGVILVPRFNSGLGVIQQKSLRLDWMEEFLAIPGIEGHFWRIEQTLYALCSSRYGVELLPEEYSVRLTGSVNGHQCRHYVGAIRHKMYREGIRRLIRSSFLEHMQCAC
jgi:hypothetical protein